MSVLSMFLQRFRAPAASAPAAAAPPSPPELFAAAEGGLLALRFLVEQYRVLPLGSQELYASAVHQGRPVALEVVLGPDWREGAAGGPAAFHGLVTLRAVGAESDALLRALDERFGTAATPSAMAKLTDYLCESSAGDPRDLRAGPLRATLTVEPEGEGEGDAGFAALALTVDLAAKRLELLELDPSRRAAIVRGLSAAPSR